MDEIKKPLNTVFIEKFKENPLYQMRQNVASTSPFQERSSFHENRCGEFHTVPLATVVNMSEFILDLAKNIDDPNYYFNAEDQKVLFADFEGYPLYYERNLSFDYVNLDGQTKHTKIISVSLNKRICRLDPNIGVRLKVDSDSNEALFTFRIYYEGTREFRKEMNSASGKVDFKIDDKYVAIQFSTGDPEFFEDTYLRLKGGLNIRNEIISEFMNAYSQIDSVTDLKWFYELAPEYVINFKEIGKELLWKDLISILDYDAEGWFSWFKDSSNAMINIVKAFCATDAGIAYLYKKFDNDQAQVKRIYEHLQGNSMFDGQELPNKTIFASLITALTDLQITQILNADGPQKRNPRDRTDVLFKLTKGYRVDSNIYADDESSQTFVLTQQRMWVEERTYQSYPTGGSSGGGSGTYEHTEWRNEQDQTYSLHPMDIVMVELSGPFGFPMTVPLPAIYVKDVAHHEEWGRAMQIIRLAVNILMIVVSVATIMSGAGLLLTTLAWIDLGLAVGDITVQAFEKQLRDTEWGSKFLEIWDAVYTIGSFVTVAPMIGNLLVNGARVFLKLVNKEARLRLATMLEFAISRSQKFSDVLVAGQFKVISSFTDFATDISRKLLVLRAEGFLLIQETKALGGKLADSIADKFHLIYWDTIIYTTESLADLKAFLNRVVKNGKVVFKEVEEFSLDQFYKKGYDYVEMGMPSKNIIKAMFGPRGQKLVSVVDREVTKLKKMIDPETGKVFSGNKLRDRMLVAGIACRKYTTEIITHTNYPRRLVEKYLKENNLSRGAFELIDIKNYYRHLKQVGFIKNEMHPLLEARIKEYLKRAKNVIKHSDNYSLSQTGGMPGAHAEILSINEMLWKLESKGVNLDARIFTEMMGFNRQIAKPDVMIRCLDCHFISFNVPFIEKIIP